MSEVVGGRTEQSKLESHPFFFRRPNLQPGMEFRYTNWKLEIRVCFLFDCMSPPD
jgi:hypothetical protein